VTHVLNSLTPDGMPESLPAWALGYGREPFQSQPGRQGVAPVGPNRVRTTGVRKSCANSLGGKAGTSRLAVLRATGRAEGASRVA
jgi:hypothetical protein